MKTDDPMGQAMEEAHEALELVRGWPDSRTRDRNVDESIFDLCAAELHLARGRRPLERPLRIGPRPPTARPPQRRKPRSRAATR
jgi:hypothetical protein